MRTFLARRLALAAFTLVAMSVVIFVLLRLVPGNIVDLLFQSAGLVDPSEKQRLAHELLLDRPVAVQYVQWAAALLHGDLGKSYRYGLPAWQIIRPRIPITVELAVLAMAVSIAIGLPTGVVSATRQNTWLDYGLRIFSLAGLSMPAFWLGMVIIILLVRTFGWIPSMLYIAPWVDLRAHLLQFLFPALSAGYRSAALINRITRSSMLEVLREDYVRTGRAKGLAGRSVVYRHALKNALLPVVTVIGTEFAFLIGGLIVTETVFNLPGVARYLVDAILWRDYPVVQNLVMFIAIVVVLANLAVDVLYARLDPRVRYA
ncbi:MAG TPA: ABC transporter permease [bacterium]|nr:ABC transporter permease [bacterium]